ncbi:MAG: GAF domain-containing protein [Woeseiaceae bacterium]
MQKARLPDDEANRLATLRNLHILDTPRDDRFDRFTRLATRIFDMPIALISLVDETRQWFKSVEGFDGEETPREFSFCAHAILGDEVFEVQNSRQDNRFRDNPLVVEQPHIRYYAGAPLLTPDGSKIGTLCVIDRVPRRLDDEDKRVLKDLADMVVDEMISYVDPKTDLANRHALFVTGSRLFDHVATDTGMSLLLFDISGISRPRSDSESRRAPASVFAELLRSYFRSAESIAHIGGRRFCVLLKENPYFDEAKATNLVCVATKKAMRGYDQHGFLSALVGRVQFDSKRHASFDEMLSDADGMFFNHQDRPSPDYADSGRFVKAVMNWRKTIF